MRLKYVVFVAAAISVVLLLAFPINMQANYEPLPITEKVTPTCYPPGKEPSAPDFALVDQYGREVRLSDLWGDGPLLITFTYTYCPDICPVMHVIINKSLPGLTPVVKRIATISVDPERDTPERMKLYAEANNYRWIFLTGPRAQLERVWDAYGIFVSIQRTGDTYVVTHSADWIVIEDGKILGRVRGMPSPESLVEYVTLIAERRCMEVS